MFNERQKHEWDKVAELSAVIINMNGGNVSPADLNPYRERVKLNFEDSMRMLKSTFVKEE